MVGEDVIKAEIRNLQFFPLTYYTGRSCLILLDSSLPPFSSQEVKLVQISAYDL